MHTPLTFVSERSQGGCASDICLVCNTRKYALNAEYMSDLRFLCVSGCRTSPLFRSRWRIERCTCENKAYMCLYKGQQAMVNISSPFLSHHKCANIQPDTSSSQSTKHQNTDHWSFVLLRVLHRNCFLNHVHWFKRDKLGHNLLTPPFGSLHCPCLPSLLPPLKEHTIIYFKEAIRFCRFPNFQPRVCPLSERRRSLDCSRIFFTPPSSPFTTLSCSIAPPLFKGVL